MTSPPLTDLSLRRITQVRLPLTLWLLLIWGASSVAFGEGAPSSLVICLAAAFLPYGWLVAQRTDLDDRTLVALVLLAGLPLVFAPSGLSDDLYRYLWDARVWRSGTDPYLFAPSDPALSDLRDVLWRRVNNPQIPTIYPPIAQGVFVIADVIAHAPWSIKLLMLGGHLGMVVLLRRTGPSWAATAWALNPLALTESALGGHVDVLVGMTLLAFVLALQRRRLGLAMLFVLAASGLKLVGLALAPLVGSRSRRAMALFLVIAALPVVPLITAGSGSQTTGGLGQYARRWRGNESLYAWVETGVAAGLVHVGGVAPGRVRFERLRPFFESLDGTVLDPRASFMPEKKPIWDVAEFELHVLAAILARLLIVLIVFGLALGLGWKRVEPLVAARVMLWAILLLAPQIHPWYLLWLLPIELAAGRVTGLVWSVLVLVAYAPLDGWHLHRQWLEPAGQASIQYGIVLIALASEFFLPRWIPALRSDTPPSAQPERELSPRPI